MASTQKTLWITAITLGLGLQAASAIEAYAARATGLKTKDSQAGVVPKKVERSFHRGKRGPALGSVSMFFDKQARPETRISLGKKPGDPPGAKATPQEHAQVVGDAISFMKTTLGGDQLSTLQLTLLDADSDQRVRIDAAMARVKPKYYDGHTHYAIGSDLTQAMPEVAAKLKDAGYDMASVTIARTGSSYSLRVAPPASREATGQTAGAKLRRVFLTP